MTLRQSLSRVRRAFRSFGRSQGGVAAAEFALIAPTLILLMACAFEVGRALQSVQAVNKLASQYAIAWADCTDEPAGTCGGTGSTPTGELAQYANTNAIANLAPQLNASAVTLQMFQVTMSGTTPTVVHGYPGGTLTATQIAAAQSVLQTSGQSGVIVTVSYTYRIAVFSSLLANLVPATIPMTYTIAQLKA
jgi:Flp pilus assembly protein TadG